MTSITCDDTGSGQTSTGNTATRTATFNLDPGETVKCTFTNTQRGSISGYKYDDANGNGINTGDWTPVVGWIVELWQGASKITQTATNGSGFYSFTNLAQGAYQLIEQMLAGWTNVSPSTINVTLTPGEADTGNNFVNTRYGTIIVEKQTVPNGSQQSFDFDLSYGDGDADLIDGGQDSTGNLLPGTYSVSEHTPAGWDLTSAVCSDGSSPSSISLQSGERVTCVFTNTQRGQIVVDKVTIPSRDPQSFTFIPSYGSSFGLTDADSPNNSGYLVPGSYSVSESAQTGWTLTDTTCVSSIGDTESAGSLELDAGETITCTFTNTKKGHIIIDKVTDPSGDSQSFTFDASGGSYADFSLTDAATPNDQELVPGAYEVGETVPGGWDLTNITCADPSQDSSGMMPTAPTATINVAAGETVTCTFTNTQRGSIAGRKYNDVNGNGLFDEIEKNDINRLDGWTIHIFDNVWVQIAEMETGDDSTPAGPVEKGQYLFTNLQPGTYRVCEDLQNGWKQTEPSSGPERNSTFCREVVVTPGQKVTLQHFGNFQLGQITACKYVDANGSGLKDAGDTSLSNISMILSKYVGSSWTPQSTQATSESGCTVFTGLAPGQYRVQEDYSDTDLADYYPVNGSKTDQKQDFTVTSGSSQTVDFLNAHYRTISGTKYNDLNGNGSQDTGEAGLVNWTIFIDYNNDGDLDGGEPSTLTDATGYYEFTGLVADTYIIAEDLQTGWTQTQPAAGHYDRDLHVAVTSTGNDFGNVQLRDIHGYKWNDRNGDGIRQTCQEGFLAVSAPGLTRDICQDEELLPGWMIFLDLNGNGILDNGEPSMETSSLSGHEGWYWFENLLPGAYQICEVQQGGWDQTSSPVCHTITLPDGENTCGPQMVNYIAEEEPTCNFGNKQLNPILTITKENNTGGASMSPGDSVLFTTATQSAAYNVEMTDLPSGGFTYMAGSWTSHNSNGTDLKANGTTTEPTYASPGVWKLGTIQVGETVTVTYLADISGSQKPGYYYDLAWADGCKTTSTCARGDSMYVLSDAINPGFVDDHYVGTEVKILTSQQTGVDIKVVGEVLGASTELPATGANTFWLYVAVALITTGVSVSTLGWLIRRKYA